MLPIKRTNLERFDVPQGDYETVIMRSRFRHR